MRKRTTFIWWKSKLCISSVCLMIVAIIKLVIESQDQVAFLIFWKFLWSYLIYFGHCERMILSRSGFPFLFERKYSVWSSWFCWNSDVYTVRPRWLPYVNYNRWYQSGRVSISRTSQHSQTIVRIAYSCRVRPAPLNQSL